MRMNWAKPYNASYRLYGVSRDTWSDAWSGGTTLKEVSAASVECDLSKDLLQSGSVTIDLHPGEVFERGYYRLVMVTEQMGGHERFDVSTLYYTTSTRNTLKGLVTMPLVGRSVLYPASRRKMIAGSYAPMGVDGAAYAAELLSACILAPVTVHGGFTLDQHVVHEVGTTYLEAASDVLAIGGFCIRIDGHGNVTIQESPSQPDESLGFVADIIQPSTNDTLDTSAIHNRYTAIDGSQTVTVTNDDPDSEVSTVSRGYYDDEVDTSPQRINGETLTHYATRKLAEQSIARRTYTYSREYVDGLSVGDIIPITINGDAVTLRSERQGLSCTASGIVVSEQASMEVALWQG